MNNTAKKPRSKSGSLVIAATMEMSPSELSEYRYQAKAGWQPIYAIDSSYFAASLHEPKTPRPVGGPWRKHSDQFWAERNNTVLWVCDSVSE